MTKLDRRRTYKLFSCRNRVKATHLMLFSSLLGSFLGFAGIAHAETSFERLSSLLAATPDGGWVKASENLFSDAWPTGADAVPLDSYKSPGQIVRAWSSFAWDSSSGTLMLWGGGHANYGGNEMYLWSGSTGDWSRGSLPSRIDANYFVVDGNAPQSAHTYNNNLYLPVNRMFLTFGGPTFQSGTGYFQKTDGQNVTRAGPFLWDPEKADPNKVGGTTGSGWNTTNIAGGGNMWIDRQGNWTGTEPGSYTQGTTAHRTENGKDVVYLTADQNGSGFPSLFRYTLGDVRNGGRDTWEKIGVTFNTVGYQGAATIDTTHDLYIKTATVLGNYTSDLAVWDLSKANAANPLSNTDIGINLVNADGSDFKMNSNYGVDYDPVLNAIVLWDGSGDGGTVWEANVLTDENGKIGSNTTWIIHEVSSSTSNHPHGNFETGVLGKWHYDSSLGAFIALDNISTTDGGALDAGVWLYKPTAVTAVPEPGSYIMLLAGLSLMGAIIRRRRLFPDQKFQRH